MLKKNALYVIIAIVLAAVIGVAAFVVVDRLGGTSDSLAAATSTQSSTSSTGGWSSQSSTSATTETEVTPGQALSVETTTSEAATAGTSSAQSATASSYKSDTVSISIKKVSTGSGNNTVTYFVADVQLEAGTLLQAGLAEGFKSGKVANTSTIAKQNDAILAINGDYSTGRNTGIIIRDGVLYLNNPTREGLALYKDGTMKLYDETKVSADQLLADGVYNTYSFGPALLADGTIPDGLDTTEVEDIGVEHTILGNQPRTGVGIIDANHYVFIVVDGRSNGYSRGVALSEFAQIFKDLGCTIAYNLDGGGSSAMYFNGTLVNNPLGRGSERAVSDILYVK